MRSFATKILRPWLPMSAAFVALAGSACKNDGPSLSKLDEAPIPNVPAPPENGPKLGVIAPVLPVRAKPATGSPEIGYLNAGTLVARNQAPVRPTEDCATGYYAIFPRGFVCAGDGASTALEHPTLVAMAIRPAQEEQLPYAYGRVTADTALLEREPGRDDGARKVGDLKSGAGMAIVGSWTAHVAGGPAERLGLLTSGQFVRASDLRAAEPSAFTGYEVGDDSPLPVAFVVKRGVRAWKLESELPEKLELLDYHARHVLTGRYRTVDGIKYWATENKSWLRHQDVTVVFARTKVPDFVQEKTRWIDVSVVTGTLVAYEGKRPIYATLASVGRDRLGDPAVIDTPQAVTKLGTFEVVAKHVTFLAGTPERAGERFPLYDLPWALELSSGQLLYGAYWHDRFGIEHGPGDVTLSVADARRVWQWATPTMPKGWHAAKAEGEKTIVVVRK